MKQFLLQVGVTMILIGAILFAVSPPVFNMAVVETEHETWYDASMTLIPEGQTSFSKWIRSDEKIVITANVIEPSDPSIALIRLILTDGEGADLIDQIVGTLDTDILARDNQYFEITVSNAFDSVNSKVIDLSIFVEREVVVMQEVPNNDPVAGFSIFIVGAVLFIGGSFMKGGIDE